jgi:hypothetical protein
MKSFSYAFIVLIVSMTLLAACASAPQPTTASTQAGYPAQAKPTVAVGYPAASKAAVVQPNAAAAYPPDGVIMQITKADGKSVPIEFKSLSALAKQAVTLENKQENVSKLNDALSLGGVTSFTKLIVTGSNGSLELTKDQAAQAYLDVPANGNVRLLVQGVSSDKWLTGVSGIKIQ